MVRADGFIIILFADLPPLSMIEGSFFKIFRDSRCPYMVYVTENL